MLTPQMFIEKFVVGPVMVLVINLNDEGESVNCEKFIIIPLLIQSMSSNITCKQTFCYYNISALIKCLQQADNWIFTQQC